VGPFPASVLIHCFCTFSAQILFPISPLGASCGTTRGASLPRSYAVVRYINWSASNAERRNGATSMHLCSYTDFAEIGPEHGGIHTFGDRRAAAACVEARLLGRTEQTRICLRRDTSKSTASGHGELKRAVKQMVARLHGVKTINTGG